MAAYHDPSVRWPLTLPRAVPGALEPRLVLAPPAGLVPVSVVVAKGYGHAAGLMAGRA